jgi:hypothetical protein
MSNEMIALLLGLNVLNIVGLVMLGLRVGDRRREESNLEQRIVRLEVRVDALPTHHDLTALHRELGKTAETVATISGQTQTITTMLRTIQQHLLESDP